MQNIAEKHKPILMVSKKEKYKLLNCYYKISKNKDEICIQYWFTWDFSRANRLSKILGYGKDHDFDLEPIFVYLKDNKIDRISFDAGHYSKKTINDPELKNERPIIKVINYSHGYKKYKNQKGHSEKDYRIKILDKKVEDYLEKEAVEVGKSLAPMYHISIKPILKNPWNFYSIPKKHIIVYLSALMKGDKDAKLFCELKKKKYINQ